jgi:hypothetical protein
MRFRQLDAKPITVEFMSEAEVERVVFTWLRKVQPGDEAIRFTRALAALGCLPRELDPLPIRARMLTQRVGGWFDDEKESIIIVDPNTNPPPKASSDKALAIVFGLLLREYGSGLLPRAGERLSTDMRLSRESLLAGDAALTRHLFAQQNPTAGDKANAPDDDSFRTINQAQITSFLEELDLFPFIRGFEYAQTLNRDGSFSRLNEAYSRLSFGTAEIRELDVYRDPSHSTPPREICFTSEMLYGVTPFWDDELGQFACLALLRAYNSDENAELGTRGLIADRLLAWEAKGVDRHHAAWQTLWQGTEHAAAFEDAITKVLVERYGVITRSGEGFAFNAKGRHVSLSRNRNSLGVLLLDTADTHTLQTLANMLLDDP